MIKIREFQNTLEDMAAVVEIDNAMDPEDQYTVEELRYDLENFDTTKYTLRYYLAEERGGIVGYACYHHMPHRFHPQRFWFWGAVHPAFQGHGIGTALYERIIADLQGLSGRWLHTAAKETWEKSLRFLERRGFREVMRGWKLCLHVQEFDPRLFQGYLEKTKQAGIVITTLAEEAKYESNWLSKVYELHTAVVVDVPSSSPITPVPIEHFQRNLIENPDLLLDGFFVAKDGDKYVGESFLFRVPAEPGHLAQGLTGVRQEYRGRGVAMALKLHVIQYAKERGHTLIKTWNSSVNASMLAINEKLGFVRQVGWIEFEKVLA